jgi:hypothetical protein
MEFEALTSVTIMMIFFCGLAHSRLPEEHAACLLRVNNFSSTWKLMQQFPSEML